MHARNALLLGVAALLLVPAVAGQPTVDPSRRIEVRHDGPLPAIGLEWTNATFIVRLPCAEAHGGDLSVAILGNGTPDWLDRDPEIATVAVPSVPTECALQGTFERTVPFQLRLVPTRVALSGPGDLTLVANRSSADGSTLQSWLVLSVAPEPFVLPVASLRPFALSLDKDAPIQDILAEVTLRNEGNVPLEFKISRVAPGGVTVVGFDTAETVRPDRAHQQPLRLVVPTELLPVTIEVHLEAQPVGTGGAPVSVAASTSLPGVSRSTLTTEEGIAFTPFPVLLGAIAAAAAARLMRRRDA